MKSKRIISVLSVFGVLLLVSAGSLIPGILFAYKEKKLLSEHGIMEVEVPVFFGQEEPIKEDGSREPQLETEQIEQTLRLWANCNAEVVHEPKAGQLSMEEAFAAAKTWVGAMAENAGFPFSLFDSGRENGGEDFVSAVLSMASGRNIGLPGGAMGEAFREELYYSYWGVSFRNRNAVLSLSVNAMTGQVWEAELILYTKEKIFLEDFDYRSLLKFLELSGVENPVGGYVEQENGAVFYLADTLIYAQMERQSEQWVYVWGEEGVQEEKPCMQIRYGLGVIK